MTAAHHMTRPERAAQNMQWHAVLTGLRSQPGFSMCAFCMHGISGWGIHACSKEGNTYPMCSTQSDMSFEPDLTKTPKV